MISIGFIRTGNMGAPMARNLLKAGFKLHAYDVVASSLEPIQAAGAEAADSAVDAAAKGDIVITMLPAGKHVASVYLGDEGIIAATKPGTLLIDCSTIDVKTARDVARS